MIIAAITAVVSIIGCAATTAKPQDLQAETSALTDPLNLAHLQRNTQLPAHAALHLSGTMPHEYSDSFAPELTKAALHRQWHLYPAYHQGNHVQGITLWAEGPAAGLPVGPRPGRGTEPHEIRTPSPRRRHRAGHPQLDPEAHTGTPVLDPDRRSLHVHRRRGPDSLHCWSVPGP